MRFQGTIQIAAPRQPVWNALTTPATLAELAPGVRQHTIIIPHRQFELHIAVPFANSGQLLPVLVEWSHMIPPNSLHIEASSAEDVRGIAQVELVEERGTMVRFSAEITTLPPKIPTPLLHSFIKTAIRKFFTNLKCEVEGA